VVATASVEILARTTVFGADPEDKRVMYTVQMEKRLTRPLIAPRFFVGAFRRLNVIPAAEYSYQVTCYWWEDKAYPGTKFAFDRIVEYLQNGTYPRYFSDSYAKVTDGSERTMDLTASIDPARNRYVELPGYRGVTVYDQDSEEPKLVKPSVNATVQYAASESYNPNAVILNAVILPSGKAAVDQAVNPASGKLWGDWFEWKGVGRRKPADATTPDPSSALTSAGVTVTEKQLTQMVQAGVIYPEEMMKILERRQQSEAKSATAVIAAALEAKEIIRKVLQETNRSQHEPEEEDDLGYDFWS
jgi:hypothetical protein